jgi:hypothetical protein
MDTNDHAGSKQALKEIVECRAVAIGNQEFGECLCAGPNSCEYALPFGYAFLCQHPRLKEIVENTRKSTPAVTSA